jgi:hypothetical protein
LGRQFQPAFHPGRREHQQSLRTAALKITFRSPALSRA